MAGTLDPLYIKAMAQATVEPFVQVSISLSGATFYVHNAHNDTVHASGNALGDPLLISITEVAQSFDVVNRQFQIGTIQIEILSDAYTRSLITSEDWFNTNVLVQVGTIALTNAELAHVFYGRVERVYGREGSIFIDCTPQTNKIVNYKALRSFGSDHPLESLSQMIQDAGVTVSQIDTTTFASNAFSDLSHYCYSSYGFGIYLDTEEDAPLYSGRDLGDGFVHRMHDSSGVNAQYNQFTVMMTPLVDKFAQEYCELTGSVLINDLSSKVKMVRADKTAAVTRHLTVDDYSDFEQDPDSVIYNRVRVDIGGGDQNGTSVEIKDTDSITKYGERKYKTLTRYFANAGKVAGTAGVTGSTVEPFGPGTFGFSGTRNLHATQTADDKIDAGNPFYCAYRNEIFKTTTPHTDALPGVVGYWEFDEEGSSGSFGNSTYAEGTLRPSISGLSALAGASPTEAAHEDYLYDVTMAYQFCEMILDRFSNSAPKIRFKLGLDHIDLEPGDVISIDNDWFVAPELSLDGLNLNTKFEITKKETDLTGDGVGISLEAVYLTTSSPPSVTKIVIPPAFYKESLLRQGATLAANLQANAAASVISNAEVVLDSGLNCTLGAGRLLHGGEARQLADTVTVAVTANKDTYIGIDGESGVLLRQEVSTGGDEPNLLPSEIRLAKVIAGGSVTSILDLRNLGAITPQQVNREHMAPGFNTLWNAGFEFWPDPGTMATGWEVTNGTFGTDSFRESSVVHSGRYSLKMNSAVNDVTVRSVFVPVDSNQPLEVGVWVRQKTSTHNITINAAWFQPDKTASATTKTAILSGALSAADTWEHQHAIIETPSDAGFVRLDFIMTTAQAGVTYFDDCFIQAAMPSFHATGAATTSVTKDTETQVELDTESHDHGGNYDNTATNYKFVVPSSGVYEFQGTVKVAASGGAASSIYGRIKNNGTVIKEALGGIDSGAGFEASVTVVSGPMEFSQGDEVTLYIEVGGRGATIQTASKATYFSGRRVR